MRGKKKSRLPNISSIKRREDKKKSLVTRQMTTNSILPQHFINRSKKYTCVYISINDLKNERGKMSIIIKTNIFLYFQNSVEAAIRFRERE